MKEQNLIKSIIELVLDAQRDQTRKALEELKTMPETKETRELLANLLECDRKIESQCRLVLRAERLASKMTLLN